MNNKGNIAVGLYSVVMIILSIAGFLESIIIPSIIIMLFGVGGLFVVFILNGGDDDDSCDYE